MTGDVGQFLYQKEQLEPVAIENTSEELEDCVTQLKFVMFFLIYKRHTIHKSANHTSGNIIR